MIEVPIEVGSGDARVKVLARAQSIRGAIRAVKKRYPGAAVNVVFPLGPEFFFAGTGTEELIELDGPEVAASPASRGVMDTITVRTVLGAMCSTVRFWICTTVRFWSSETVRFYQTANLLIG